jgi:phage-related minor tail protein
MFGSLFEYARLSASSVTNRLVASLAIAVPCIFAFGFGIAAIYIALANRYSELTAAISLTIAFAIIALLVAGGMAMWQKRQEQKRQEALSRARNSVAASALMAANPAMLLGVGRMAVGVARRAPLLTILPLAAGFIYAWSRSSHEDDEAELADRV